MINERCKDCGTCHWQAQHLRGLCPRCTSELLDTIIGRVEEAWSIAQDDESLSDETRTAIEDIRDEVLTLCHKHRRELTSDQF